MPKWEINDPIDGDNLLIFETLDLEWLASDLVLLLNSIEVIYDFFMSAAILRKASLVVGSYTTPERTEYFESGVFPSTESAGGGYGWSSGSGQARGSSYSGFANELQSRISAGDEVLLPLGSRSANPILQILAASKTTSSQRLSIDRIVIASPGIVSLKGSGEVIGETRRLLNDTVTTRSRLRKAKAEAAGAEEDVRHDSTMNRLEEERVLIDNSVAKVKAVTEMIEQLFGSNWRESSDAMAELKRVLQATGGISELVDSGKLALPASGETST